ncbi:30S ribosomal protein S3 [Candidatus Bipolaricaulota bacterium]
MGQKIHPLGFRIGVNRKWVSNWYNPALAPEYVAEDKRVRDLIAERYRRASVSEINIERSKEDRVSIVIRSARPGIIIGRGGSEIEKLQAALEDLTERQVKVSIQEIERPDLEARLVAQDVAIQIENRTAPARVMKEAMRRVMGAGAGGVKFKVSGRLGGADIARSITMKEGRIPLQTIRADIDYGLVEARTKYGNIGIKVWIYRGDHPRKSQREEVN